MRWLLALAALLFAVAAPAKGPDNGRFVEFDQAAEFGPLKVTVWLPPGYERDTRRRYPVLYMHDGRNVFFPERSGYNKVWAADKAALGLIRARKVAPFIIVAVDHPPGAQRYLRYFPTKVASVPLRKGIEESVKGQLNGESYLTLLGDTVKPRIDREFRTRPAPRFTAVAGSSMGGLITLYAMVERADVFGRGAAVSIHSPLIGPDQLAKRPELADEVKASWRRYLAQRLGVPGGRKLWMDHGTATLDQYYAPYQAVIDAEVERAGWRKGTDFASKVYEGAEHEENAWARRLPEIFAWLLSDWKP